MSDFPVGKIPADFLASLWQRHAHDDPSVIVGPGIGMDVAVLDLGDEYLVAKTDPITFASDRIGWYAVHVNSNDIACSGATPEWFLATLLLPETQADAAEISKIFESIREGCDAVGASLVGGHSEVTSGLDRVILVGSMLGRVAKSRLRTSAGARPGDHLLLAGGIPIEATAILAREFSDRLSGTFDDQFLDRCRNFLFDPGISVLDAARIAADFEGVHAMHDPTEGGLATGVFELAQASGVDISLRYENIPILSEGRQLCEHLALDALGIIASGALLISVSPADSGTLMAKLQAAEITCAKIGELSEGDGRVSLERGGRTSELEPPARDELARLFGELK